MKKKISIKTIIITIITLILLAISLFPFYYMVVQSFTSWDLVDKTLVPAGLLCAATNTLSDAAVQPTH